MIKNGILLFVMLSSIAQATISVPKKYMDKNFTVEANDQSRFDALTIQSQAFVTMKTAEWQACHQQPEARYNTNFMKVTTDSRAAISQFLENVNYVDGLRDLDRFRSGTVDRQPWSGDYWAYARGLLGVRFLSPEFNQQASWKDRFDFVNGDPANKVLSDRGQDGVSQLSPSEKYDLLIGDQNGKLTESMWRQGQMFYLMDGDVEGWMGICHGWSPAAIEMPRPNHSVDLSSLDGNYKVHLNPSEIKGLVSFNWATNSYSAATVGHRCTNKNPSVDPSGHIMDPTCFDMNPADWHTVVVNQVGVNKKSFIIDATYDYQVWNQPVLGYSYSYFNPVTMKAVDNLDAAVVKKEDFQKDKFAKFRPANMKYVVGVSMKLGYIVETSANDSETDSVQMDQIRWVQYQYDLELDSKMNIIGGEWYQVAHPDFAWRPLNREVPSSGFEANLSVSDWNNGVQIPVSWGNQARMASAQGKILDVLTEALDSKAQ